MELAGKTKFIEYEVKKSENPAVFDQLMSGRREEEEEEEENERNM